MRKYINDDIETSSPKNILMKKILVKNILINNKLSIMITSFLGERSLIMSFLEKQFNNVFFEGAILIMAFFFEGWGGGGGGQF